MQQMLQQVQKMQQEMEAAQEELKNEIVEASAGGGMVTVKVGGDLELKAVKIDPAAVDPEDVEMLGRHGARGRQRGAAHGPGARRRASWAGPPAASTWAVSAGWAFRACEQLLRSARPDGS